MSTHYLLREKVYDPVLRSIHAWLGLCILLLILSSQAAAWLAFTPEAAMLWRFHVWIGEGLILGLVGRLTWAWVGPRHAHWHSLWTWRAWLAALRQRAWFTPPGGFGHHPVATAAYMFFYTLALLMAISGLALAAIDQGQGPLASWLGYDLRWKTFAAVPHDWMEEGIILFVLLHIAALILHESRHGIPMAQAMVSGYQYRDTSDSPAPGQEDHS